jgi:hypothetical protein
MFEIIFNYLKIKRDVREWYNDNNLVQASGIVVQPYTR